MTEHQKCIYGQLEHNWKYAELDGVLMRECRECGLTEWDKN